MAMERDETAIFPVMPLKEIVVFPNNISPLYVVRQKSLAALEEAINRDKVIFVTAQKNAEIENPSESDLYSIGTVAEILQVLRVPDGSAKILVQGQYVGQIVDVLKHDKFLQALIVRVPVKYRPSKQIEALMRTTLRLFESYAKLSDKIPEDLWLSIKNIDNPVGLANAIANYAALKTKDKQEILETLEAEKKFLQLIRVLDAENELLELENKILSQVKSQIGKSQKEYYLSEQLKAIEKELGIGSEEDIEFEELAERIEKNKLSKEARAKAQKELSRLTKMAPLSPEATVSRTYLEWLTELPWGKYTKDHLDLDRAQRILDEDHYGLEKIKERIIEYLAVHKLVKNMKGPILCFVGPPGVGKTSLARSIARTLGRRFVRVSLGGVRDEAEIRGHRRTYVGALPGKIIQSIKKASSMNPVFLMDEIDKMSVDFRGDPSAALLEVLDPEQNKAFNDHYLEVDFDLSEVLFITTANTIAGIPPALIDRMEVLRLPGYTQDEKLEIATQFLIRKQLKSHGLSKRNLIFTTEAIEHIITGYTREAGVRNLEREIASICRKVAKKMVHQNRKWLEKIDPEKVREYLGPVRFKDLPLHGASEIGVATGLAWTDVGGEILPTETTIMKGKGNLVLTGKLGEVMQESAKTALSYIRSRTARLNINENFYKTTDIHIHIPEGAIAKDGPSAGVTMATSMVSALSNCPVRQDIAMTGEITLRGKVLKIGGLKEKILAAHRANIRTVIIPRENQDDLEDISEKIRKDIKIILVENLDEVIDAALVRKLPARSARAARQALLRSQIPTPPPTSKTHDARPHPPIPQGHAKA
jgi:ATP-dependent Lon protease